MAEHLRGPRTSNDASNNSNDKRETKQSATKRDANGRAKRGKDGRNDRKTQVKPETREFPTKWKPALETFINKHMT